jgi:hypothetical protein
MVCNLFVFRRLGSLLFIKVALERIKEYSELQTEAPEFVEPRPPASWPSKGEIACENLVIRYAVRGYEVLMLVLVSPIPSLDISPTFPMCCII